MRTLYFAAVVSSFLWPPYGIEQVIIFSYCGFFFFFFFFLSSFFPRLFSAVAHWMSTILPHTMWPQCEFRRHVWNVLHAARWKYRMQRSPKIRRLRTIAQLCPAIPSQLRHVSTIGKQLVKQQHLLHMSSQYGELTADIGLLVWGTPANFNRFRVLASLLYRRRSPEANQTVRCTFGRLLGWYTIYTFS